VSYELWDVESRNLIGTFDTLPTALAEVRDALRAYGEGYSQFLELGVQGATGGSRTIATGDRLVSLVRLARGRLQTALVIEDDPWTLTVTKDVLDIEGFAVLEAQDGEDGLAQARAHLPDVILLDVVLPGKSGLDVLRELKSNPSTAGIPVIVVSAHADRMAEVDRRLVAGAVQKPFDYNELVEQIEQATRTVSTAASAPDSKSA